MAASSTVKNLSSSWGWGGGPDVTTDNIFQQMAAQGQSFFNAVGDSDAFIPGSSNDIDNHNQVNIPSGSPYITQVGGTTLTMNGNGVSYYSETVWNWGVTNNNGGFWGSCGGVSSDYSIPSWQAGINMTANLGSTTKRNVPDVALTADNIFVYHNNGAGDAFGGTSCAAPLWAGFMALVNQQIFLGTGDSNSSAGFINPAVYAIGKGQNASYSYASCFQDTTTGDNAWSKSDGKYPAVAGYDLCTGWGTPNGQNLIGALSAPFTIFGVTPSSGFAASGTPGGPFTPSSLVFALTNSSASSLNWSIINTSAWLNVSSSGGTLAAGAGAAVTASLAPAATNLPLGTFTATLLFSNATTKSAQPRLFSVHVSEPLVLLTTNGFAANGPTGGPFYPSGQTVAFTNIGPSSVPWSLINTAPWLTVSSSSGSIPVNGFVSLTVSTNAVTANLPNGAYSTGIVLSNQSSHVTQSLNITLLVGQSIVQNGGFETGNYFPWTLADDGQGFDLVHNGITPLPATSYSVITPHSGNFDFVFGSVRSPGYLSQNLPTGPGQAYVVSFWLKNPYAGSTQGLERFQVSWNGATVYSITNPPVMPWTNLNLVVQATSPSTALQFAGQNVQFYFGLDDVSVVPIPNPTITGVAPNGNGIAMTLNSLPGVSYLLQYKTNLMQADWVNITTNISAGNTIVITNAPGSDPDRFYRVLRLP
jgi:hypothetical protein